MGERPHQFKNLPMTASGWDAIVKPLKTIYWDARRDDKTENHALLLALDALWTNIENSQ